jgi:hypothetical protein
MPAQDEFGGGVRAYGHAALQRLTPPERSPVLTFTQSAIEAVNLVAPGDAALRSTCQRQAAATPPSDLASK